MLSSSPMENVRSARQITKSLQKLAVNHTSEDHMPNRCIFPAFYSPTVQVQRLKAPSLVNLCLGIVGKHFEDIVEDLADIAANFPSDIKLAMAAIARRRKLLNDKTIIDLAESSWEILDLSGSDVSDFGLAKLALICNRLRAVDISRCIKITPVGVYEALQHCGTLEVLRWGGCPESDSVARASLCLLKPKLEDMDGESWEDLDTMEIAPSLRWLIWPNIDKDSMEKLWMECPRIVVNPKPVSSVLGYNRGGGGGGGDIIPREAVDDVELDEVFVKDVDPRTWSAIGGGGGGGGTGCGGGDHYKEEEKEEEDVTISVAEKFRLAFLDRDTRLAPKRAKNARQRQRRAEREAETSTMGKALLAARTNNNMNKKNDDGYWW